MNMYHLLLDVTKIILTSAINLHFYHVAIPQKLNRKSTLGVIFYINVSLVVILPLSYFEKAFPSYQYFSMLLVDFLYLTIFKKSNYGKNIFLSVFSHTVISFISIFSTAIIVIGSNVTNMTLVVGTDKYLFIYILVSRVLQFMAFYFLAKCKYYLEYYNKSMYLMLSLLCLSSVIINMQIAVFIIGHVSYPPGILHILSWCLLTVIGSLVILNLFSKEVTDKTNLKAQMAQENIMHRYYSDVGTMHKNTLKLRHDYGNHIKVMSNLYKNGNTNELEDYIKELNEEIDYLEYPINTGNVLIDAILNVKVGSLKVHGIEIDIKCSIPSEINVSNADMCTILANLIDNAIDSCLKLEKDRYINLLVKKVKDTFIIEIINPTNGVVKMDNDRFITTKEEPGHGLGLEQVEYTCRKYGGYVIKSHQNKIFKVVVVLANISCK